MSKKRKRDTIVPIKKESGLEIGTSLHSTSKVLLENLRSKKEDLVLVKNTRLPFHRELHSKSIAEVTIRHYTAFSVELYIQWLFTGKYDEYGGAAQKPRGLIEFEKKWALIHCVKVSREIIPWTVMAAVVAWRLGNDIETPAFQDHAMRRLLQAYAQAQRPVHVNAIFVVYNRIKCPGSLLCRFLEETAIRNWGDRSVVNHEDPTWWKLIADDSAFRVRFMKGVGVPLEKRREQPMKIDDYLQDEEAYQL
ncbi:hypothetical protein BDV95DRAFT_619881 [Massariosphaeria phaeospora]|uniref:Uncharacterized protein n=1 Tax=Massariosphaeria phaeospora TaxID=100035 RepID=A0A7C8I5W2_9PLEO|nr:hypothetical protein BDV95DRAFT_619881 [Massariosphaeria phaeospora]